MDYFAGLDISMDETHVCVLDREGEVVRESKTVSTAQAIADELAKAPIAPDGIHNVLYLLIISLLLHSHEPLRCEPLPKWLTTRNS